MIPKLHYISQGNTPKEHLENIQKACAAGAELVQLNLQISSEKKYLKFAKEAREITSHFQTRFIINNHYKIAKEVKADGVHLVDINFCATIALEYLFTWQILGASANTLQECKTLIEKKVDYINLGPFRLESINNLNVKQLGTNGYITLIEALNTDTPIIATGGITTKDTQDILKTGISGIAVSDQITQDFNNIKKFNQLLGASSIDEKRHTF
ncbi:thiamine phosphate synthase [uncultured Polaribacter sp.]|uniref:thiamine phosphate synthase n=1 Tax=uncultured Polaribacter sp. TaxID=174711 RepID=UPI00260240FF|nr:thiamine phosphate synthase [uncultured Polaribacter sp.]